MVENASYILEKAQVKVRKNAFWLSWTIPHYYYYRRASKHGVFKFWEGRDMMGGANL